MLKKEGPVSKNPNLTPLGEPKLKNNKPESEGGNPR